MSLCSVADIRAKIYTEMTDYDIEDIINEVSEEVLELAGTTDISNSRIQLAGKYAAYAATLRRMRTTGELAASIKFGNSQQQNTIDADIAFYDQKSDLYIKKYKNSSFSLVSGRMGYGVVNHELS